MDEPITRADFRPDPRFTWVAGAGAVVAATTAALTGDPAGRLLVIAAALVLVGYVVTDRAFAPRLSVSAAGIAIRSPMLRARLNWAEIEDVQADTRLRLGIRATTLEVDAGPVLAVLSRRSIGTDPGEAAELIRAFRPPERG